MKLYLTIAGVAAASLLSFIFSSLTYSLREFSRQRLAELLGKRDADHWFETLTEQTADLVFLTAVARQVCNVTIWAFTFAAFEQTDLSPHFSLRNDDCRGRDHRGFLLHRRALRGGALRLGGNRRNRRPAAWRARIGSSLR